MHTLALIDDESRVRSLLRSLIEEHYSWITIVGEADSVSSGLELFHNHAPEIVLLDVEMQDGTGFDLLDQLDLDDTQVVFVTAFDHYAVKAIRANALDYIEKPVNPVDLGHALLKARSRLKQAAMSLDPSPSPTRISIPTGTGSRFLESQEISLVKADGSYCEIYLQSDPKPLVVSRKLKELQHMLTPLGFIRPNHSFLVNMAQVQEVRRSDGGSLLLKNGQEVLLSKSYKEASLQALRRFAKHLK